MNNQSRDLNPNCIVYFHKLLKKQPLKTRLVLFSDHHYKNLNYDIKTK